MDAPFSKGLKAFCIIVGIAYFFWTIVVDVFSFSRFNFVSPTYNVTSDACLMSLDPSIRAGATFGGFDGVMIYAFKYLSFYMVPHIFLFLMIFTWVEVALWILSLIFLLLFIAFTIYFGFIYVNNCSAKWFCVCPSVVTYPLPSPRTPSQAFLFLFIHFIVSVVFALFQCIFFWIFYAAQKNEGLIIKNEYTLLPKNNKEVKEMKDNEMVEF
jgi:hypothetical protein